MGSSKREKERGGAGVGSAGEAGQGAMGTHGVSRSEGLTLLSRWSWSHDSEQREWLRPEGGVGSRGRR